VILRFRAGVAPAGFEYFRGRTLELQRAGRH
jgi:hypothetical protein